jgi:hypothetical protein
MNNRLRLMVFGCVAAFGIASVSSPADAHEGSVHGNHDPHHGGLVMMYGADLHYEVVLLPTGNVSIYFTDAQRGELPASVVSDVAIEIERPSSKPGCARQGGRHDPAPRLRAPGRAGCGVVSRR